MLQTQRDGLHATTTVFGFSIGIVIRVRVDVVRKRAALCILNELNACNPDVICVEKRLPSGDQRMLEVP